MANMGFIRGNIQQKPQSIVALQTKDSKEGKYQTRKVREKRPHFL